MNIKVERLDPVPPPISKVTIDLTYEEARSLMDLCGSIGGGFYDMPLTISYPRDASFLRENVVNPIYRALCNAFKNK